MKRSSRMVPIRDALKVAALMWPRFEVREGAVVLADARGPAPSTFASLTEAEIFLNHVHVLDVVRHDATRRRAPFLDSQHEHFGLAVTLGRVLVDAWAAKLAADFPGRRFRVYFTRDDDPIVRFHQVRARQPFFLDAAKHPKGAVHVKRAGRGGVSRS